MHRRLSSRVPEHRQLRRLRVGAIATAVALAGVVAACTAGTSTGEDDGSRRTLYQDSACGKCVMSACADVFRACDATRECRAYLQCVEACPIELQSGNVEAACVSTCPVTDSVETILLARRVMQCRTAGPGLACAACGTTYDAGSDATSSTPDAAPDVSSDAHPDADAGRPKNPIVDQVCTPSTAAEKCQACEETECCDTRAACMASTECTSLGACVSACATDPMREACEAVCFDAAPAAAVTLHLARFTCLELYCAEPGACGTATLPACTACAITHCQNAFANCYDDRACRRVEACASTCNADSACVDACLAGTPDPVRQAFVEYNVCGQLSCPSECGSP